MWHDGHRALQQGSATLLRSACPLPHGAPSNAKGLSWGPAVVQLPGLRCVPRAPKTPQGTRRRGPATVPWAPADSLATFQHSRETSSPAWPPITAIFLHPGVASDSF